MDAFQQLSRDAPADKSVISPVSRAAIGKFIRLVMETQRDTYQNKLESFEVYSDKIKTQFLDTTEQYMQRIEHGYDVIIAELEKTKDVSGKATTLE